MKTGKILFDTNIFIYLLNGNKSLQQLYHHNQIYYSFVSDIELKTIQPHKQEELDAIERLLNTSIEIEMSQDIKEKCVQLRVKHRLKFADALVAATAWSHGLTLLSADKKLSIITEFPVLIFEVA
jgi:predicted nucleic acid-binding protein